MISLGDFDKKNIVNRIKQTLVNDIDGVYIIGSFLSDKWNPGKSDLDLICIDDSFCYYFKSDNYEYIKKRLRCIPYKFDIYLYSRNEFDNKYKNDKIFKLNINSGVKII